jgi:hypothetical protein
MPCFANGSVGFTGSRTEGAKGLSTLYERRFQQAGEDVERFVQVVVAPDEVVLRREIDALVEATRAEDAIAAEIMVHQRANRRLGSLPIHPSF